MSAIIHNEIDDAIKKLKDNGCGLYKFATVVLNDVMSIINQPLAYILILISV